jgi:hypothetical protein
MCRPTVCGIDTDNFPSLDAVTYVVDIVTIQRINGWKWFGKQKDTNSGREFPICSEYKQFIKYFENNSSSFWNYTELPSELNWK